ncbi:hypothetical protein ABPG75_007119 [Micractinium tetrahymenae]
MSTVATVGKRVERSASQDALLRALQQPGKRQEVENRAQVHPAVEPLLPALPGESKAAYFQRLGARLRRDLFSPASGFERDGLYIYKRPVRSGSGDKAALLASGGSVFHHVVVYVKRGEELAALEFGPANAMDITDNMLVETPAAPVLLRPTPQPEAACLPMLHIAAPHHGLEAAHVQQALAFAEATPYHALKSNCICFADFAVRVLTGGAVKGAPLIFDLLVGQVPPVDSPLLTLLGMTTELRWHDVTDGGRMMAAFLQQHGDGALLPPAAASGGGCGCEELSLLLPETAVPADKAAAAVEPAVPPVPGTPSMAALSGPLAALLSFAGVPLPPAAALLQQQQPTGSSSSSEDTCGVEVEEATAGGTPSKGTPGVVAGPAASSGSSLASCGTSRGPKGGLGLPPRTAKARGRARS